MRGSLLMALRRWTSTPEAEGDLLSSSPRSEALRTGDAWLPTGTEAPVAATVLVSWRGALVVPRLPAEGGAKPCGWVGATPRASAAVGPPPAPGWVSEGGCNWGTTP